MLSKYKPACVVAMALALSACSGDKEPTGQVVATIDEQEVTLRELQAELAGFSSPDPKARKQAETAALQAIVYRKLIARAAEEDGVDQTPDFALEKQRATEALLARTLQTKISKQVPVPTRDEVQKFIDANPNVFAQRKIFVIEQIRFPRPSDPVFAAQLQPLDTLEQVEGLLKSKGIAFRRGSDRIDAIGADPNIVNQISRLPPGELFAVPTPELLLVNQVRSTEVVPFTGPPAVKYASDVITRQRTQEAIGKRFQGIIAQEATLVKYNKAYQPPKPAAPAQKAPTAKAAANEAQPKAG